MKKKLLSMLICLSILLGMMPGLTLPVHAETYSGTCGSNLTWTLDTTAGDLTITGSGDMTFFTHYSAVPWYPYVSSINKVYISNGVTSIGDNAFYNCTGLSSIAIPDSVTYIGRNAFYYCTSLTSVAIPDSVTYIGRNAFYYCTSLTSVAIPYGVTVIWDYSFNHCSGLLDVTIPDSVTEIRKAAFYFCTSLTSVAIPDSVTVIGDAAFEKCTGLTSVTIPGSVTSIGNNAFYNCTSLANATIPDSVTVIGDAAFYNCCDLSDVVIPNGVTSIGEYAFGYCDSITTVAIPESVSSIGTAPFSGCINLTAFTVASDNPYYCNDSCGVLFNKNKTVLIQCPGAYQDDYTIPNSVTSIGESAFDGCGSLTSVTIPTSVTRIGNGAFRSCSSVKKVKIPDSVTSINFATFHGCTSLTSVTIPNSVTSIGSSAFSGCSSLTSVTIPNSVTSIANDAFYGCSSLMSVTIPNSVKSIGIEAFRGCTSLTSVTIPDSVTSIGNYAFRDCSSLTSVTIPNSVTSIGNYVFQGCSSLASVTIPNSVTSIGKYAFCDCGSLASVTIPDSVTSIGDCAFYNCILLGRVTIKNPNCTIGNHEGTLGDADRARVYGYTGSTAESYANQYGYTFVSIGSGMTATNPTVGANQAGIYVYSRAGKQPLAGVAITINAYDPVSRTYSDESTTVFTDSSGGAIMDTDGGRYLLHAEKAGYYTYQCTKTVKAGEIVQLVLKPEVDTPTVFSVEVCYPLSDLSGAQGTIYQEPTVDVLQTEHIIEENDEETFDILVYGGYNKGIKEYWLIQQGKVLKKNSNGCFYNLSAASFTAGSNIYVAAIGNDGVKGNYTLTNLIVRDDFFASGSEDTPTLDFEDKLEVEVPDDYPIIGGQKFSVDFGSLPVYMELDGDKIKVAVNVLKVDEDGARNIFTDKVWAKYKELFQDKYDEYAEYAQSMKKTLPELVNELKQHESEKGIGVGKAKLKFNIWGYLEGDIATGEASGKIKISLEGKLKREYQFHLGIPLVAEFEIHGKLEGSLLASAKVKTWSDLKLEGEFSPSLGFSAGVGPGFAHLASLTINAGGDYGADFTYSTDIGNTKRTWLTLQAFIKAKVLFAEWKWEFGKRTIYLSDTTKNLSTSPSEGTAMRDAMDLSKYTIADRSYLQGTSQWTGAVKGRVASGCSLLQSSIYDDTRLNLVQAGDTTMAFFLTDNAERADIDRTMLVYTVYDPASDTWSEPLPVEDNGTADFMPCAISDGSTIYVAWIDFSQAAMGEEPSFSEIASYAEIKLAAYDPENYRFDVETLTENTLLDVSPQLAVVNGAPCVLWTQNENSNMLCDDSANSLWFWSGATNQRSMVANNLSCIVESSLGMIGGSVVICYVTDADGDYSTVEDRSLVALDPSSGTVVFTADQASVASPQFHNGQLFWNVDGKILVWDGISEAPAVFLDGTVVGSFRIIETEEQLFVVFAESIRTDRESADNASELYACVYDKELEIWGEEVQLTDLGLSIIDYAVAPISGTLELLVTASAVSEEEDETFSVLTDLYRAKADTIASAELTSFLSYDIEQSPTEYLIPFEATVSNTGISQTDEMLLALKTESDEILSAVPVDGILAAGEQKEFEGAFCLNELPQFGTSYTVSLISADLSEQFGTVRELTIEKPRLFVECTNSTRVDDYYVLSLIVYNESPFPVSTDLLVNLDAADGETLLSFPITVEAGVAQNYIVRIDAVEIDFDDAARKIYLIPAGDFGSGTFYVIYRPHAHTLTELPAVEPTCTESGLAAGSFCSECGEILEEQIALPALGHDYDEGVCVRCGRVEPEGFLAGLTDVSSSAYYWGALSWAVHHEPQITVGTSETTFSPKKVCSRAEIVTMLWRAMGCPEPTGENPFDDVSGDAYYYKAVLWAFENDITDGVDGTHFDPDGRCSRAQTVTFLYRAAGSPDVTAADCAFEDVSENAWYRDAVLWAVDNGITDGTSATAFSPNRLCTRAQVVTFLYRFMGER